MENEDMINDIVAMLDRSVAKGVGHLNITTIESKDDLKTVEQLGCLDCANGKLACSVPTLHEGIDDKDEA